MGRDTSATTPNPIRVLIVDDNLELAENIAEVLEIEGFLTEVTGSAEEALPKALHQEIATVVTDFRLPGMSGAEFVGHVRRQRQHVHAVVISAYTDDATVAAAKTVGAAFLPKPLDLRLLTRFVRERQGPS
jgi:DNA-binding response OmpR family regulator